MMFSCGCDEINFVTSRACACQMSASNPVLPVREALFAGRATPMSLLFQSWKLAADRRVNANMIPTPVPSMSLQKVSDASGGQVVSVPACDST